MREALFYKRQSVAVDPVEISDILEGRRQVAEIVFVLPYKIDVCLFFPPNNTIPDDDFILDLIKIVSAAQHHPNCRKQKASYPDSAVVFRLEVQEYLLRVPVKERGEIYGM